MNRSKALSAVLLGLLGTQLALAAPQRAAKAKDRAGLVIFQDENPQDLSRTKILKVTVVQELSDGVVLDVEYNRAADLEGQLSLSVMPDMSDWSMTLVYLQPGKNIISQEVSLQPEVKGPVESNNLSIRIEHYKEKYMGPVFNRTVPFEKVWKQRRR